ncbi:TetR/AcrR family transcriptional regulator [Phenylobacterium sp.]|jgi:AcrR family transcriptional regulator|uniref:TetR/AcrR family transcriptional regulator n=1 Tax=Phenylobacterium sp. TaxID=1871053 RepID=UPI002F3F237A
MSVGVGLSRREEKRDERRDAILDVARQCFLAEGYATTSMSAIAARLGGSKGTLYNYFRSKDELFAAMMERQCGELSEVLFDVSSVGDQPHQRLTHYARNFLELLLSPMPMAIHRLVVAESERFPELGRAFYESGPRLVMGRIGAYLAELMDQGALRRADPIVAAQQFKDLAISGVYQPRLWGVIGDLTPEEMDVQVDRAVDTFMRAYAP